MIELPDPRPRDLYTIRDNGQYFRAGRSSDNNQVLFGILAGQDGAEVAAAWFDPSGRLLRFSTQQVTTQPGEMDDSSAHRAITEFQQACGFRPNAIHVGRFVIPDRFVRIEDIPEHYQDFLNNPDDYEPERQDELTADIKNWVEDGDFVLWWGEDYYLDSQGEVASS